MEKSEGGDFLSVFFGGAVPYLLVGLIVYLIFRAVAWLLYYRGEMRVPLWHEAGFFLLALWLLLLFASTVSPSLGFSIKPSLQNGCLIPVKGVMLLVKENGFGAVLGAVLKYIPLGFLIPFLFRRFQSFLKTFVLCGILSFLSELFQLFLSGAAVNTDEFLLSLLGTFLGYFLFGLLRYYIPGIERLGTVKRSRHREVPFLVKKELEILILLMLLTVIGRGTQLEVVRIKEEKAVQAELERQQEEARKAAEEAEAQRLAEEEARKLKKAEVMPELDLEAGAAVLFSVEDDLILYEKNGTERVVPASTTKLLTALTVLKYCDEEETMTAGEEIGLISEGASTANLKQGTRGTVKTFLGAMLVPSGNDAAYALAGYTGRRILGDENASAADAVAAFMKAMNDYAVELNLEDSHFENPDGDSADNHYTTAQDLIRIARACLENETIMELCGKSKYRALFENMDVTYQNTNQMLQPGSAYYYEGTIGLKTGSHSDTKCLVGALEAGGRRYVTVVMQDSEEGRWKDTKTLFDEAQQ